METIVINKGEFEKSHWTEQEHKNVELLIDFVQNLMNNHDFDYVKEKHGNPYYKQHNRAIPDGFENLLEYVKSFAKRFPDYAYDVKHIDADHDMVIFHSHLTIKSKHRGNDKKGFNIIDKWKVENGNIVEHWDAIQPIDGFMRFFLWLTGGSVQNSNGVY